MDLRAELPQDRPILIGLSGGADSTGLAVWACTHYPDLDWHLVHVRHGLRDDAADAKAAAQTAAKLNRPYTQIQADWSQVAQPNGPEDGARQARYAAFAQVAKRLGATHIALAHTADDQAETILMRLARGTGPTGMAGMHPISYRDGLTIVRPLLDWERPQVHQLSQGFPTVDDPTNQDLTQRRAYVRHTVLPALAGARPDLQSPAVAIARFATQQRIQQDLLNQLLTPFEGPRWGHIQRIRSDIDPTISTQLIYQALGHDVDHYLVAAIADLQVGDYRDIAQDRWAARDQFGWLIGPKKIAWTIKQDSTLTPSQPPHTPGVDPLITYPLPWSIPIPKDIDYTQLRVRKRTSADSRYKKIFNQFPKSLRKQLPVLYTEASKVVAIGPIGLQVVSPFGDNLQWITVAQRL